jgi:hypothetical protein
MKYRNDIPVKGVFEMWVYRVADGQKVLQEHYFDPNTVVSLGKEKLARLIANDGTNHHITAVSVGTSSTEPTIADTSITDAFNKNITGYSFPGQTSVKFSWELGLTDAVGKAIAEYGLICQDSTLFARKTRGVINKESDVIINGEWTISFV